MLLFQLTMNLKFLHIFTLFVMLLSETMIVRSQGKGNQIFLFLYFNKIEFN